jgi:hypothetical protein
VQPRTDQERFSSTRFTLADLLFVILVIALGLSIISRAARTGQAAEWRGVGLVLTIFATLLVPVLLLCAAVRSSPSAQTVERDAIGYFFKTLLLILLLANWMVINLAREFLALLFL